MIVPIDTNPKFSLYYIGALILDALKEEECLYMDTIIKTVLSEYKEELPISYIYYSFDWLYLLSLIEIKNNRVILCK